MSSKRVALAKPGERSIVVENDATAGAVFGVNLRWPTGELVRAEDFVAPPSEPGLSVTYWRMLREIPPNVVALAETATTGLYVIAGDGTSETRAIQAAAGETTVSNGDGVAGNPVVGLADVSVTSGGTLQKYGFDNKGRRVEEEAADTDDLEEGSANLYFTDERAQDAVGAVADDSGDVELHYETSPARRLWAALSTGIAHKIGSVTPGTLDPTTTNDETGTGHTHEVLSSFGENTIDASTAPSSYPSSTLSLTRVGTASGLGWPENGISLNVIGYGNRYGQIYFGVSGDVYSRRGQNASWDSFRKLWSDADFAPSDFLGADLMLLPEVSL